MHACHAPSQGHHRALASNAQSLAIGIQEMHSQSPTWDVDCPPHESQCAPVQEGPLTFEGELGGEILCGGGHSALVSTHPSK